MPARVPAEALAEVGGEVSRLLSSPAAIRELPLLVASGIADSVERAIHSVFLSAVPLMLLGFALSWFLKEVPLRDTIGPATPVEGAPEGLTPSPLR